MQFVPRDPYDSAPPAMTQKNVDIMFYDYLNHLVPDETHSIITPNEWSVAYNYIQ